MFDEVTRKYWLKEQLKKQLTDFFNTQKVALDVHEMSDCLEELAKEILHRESYMARI